MGAKLAGMMETMLVALKAVMMVELSELKMVASMAAHLESTKDTLMAVASAALWVVQWDAPKVGN